MTGSEVYTLLLATARLNDIEVWGDAEQHAVCGPWGTIHPLPQFPHVIMVVIRASGDWRLVSTSTFHNDDMASILKALARIAGEPE